MRTFDWIIVGGGIAGISLCEILTREGHTVALIEKNDKLADYYIQQHKDQSEVTNFLVNHTVAVAHQTNENHLSDDLIQSSKHIFTNDSYFFCNNCGYKSSILNWLCPKCNTWNDVIPKTNIDIIEEISFDKR